MSQGVLTRHYNSYDGAVLRYKLHTFTTDEQARGRGPIVWQEPAWRIGASRKQVWKIRRHPFVAVDYPTRVSGEVYVSFEEQLIGVSATRISPSHDCGNSVT